MLGELVGATLGAVYVGRAMPREAAWLGAALAAAAWLLTMFVSVPKHEVLARGFDPRAFELLVTTNWYRTVLWTARGALLLWAVARST